MPRPAARRKRQARAKAPKLADQNPSQRQGGENEVDSRLRHERNTKYDGDNFNDRRNNESTTTNGLQSKGNKSSVSGSSEIKRQITNHTPTRQVQDQAIESSPTGEHVVTGSRPPTRARGYSSTMSLGGLRGGDTSSRIPGTPGFESSVLSNFRKRPRQPSILQMMQADDEFSDLGDEDDFLGGISPQDESTPLDRSKGKQLLLGSSAGSPSKPSSPSMRKRRRNTVKSPEGQPPPSPVEHTPSISPVPRLVDVHASLESSGTLGPENGFPMSSSPLPSPQSAASILSTEHSAHPRGDRKESTTDMVGDRNPSPVRVSTATLQQKLLPRRSRRQHSRATDFEFHSDNDDNEDDDLAPGPDDDELNYLPPRGPAKSRSRNRGRGRLAVQANERKRQIRNIGEVGVENPRANTSSSKRPNDGRKFLYSSRYAVPDKENTAVGTSPPLSSPLSSPLNSDDLDSDFVLSNPTGANKFISQELRLQARKFAEIDRWEMEFEDVVPTGSQTSSLR